MGSAEKILIEAHLEVEELPHCGRLVYIRDEKSIDFEPCTKVGADCSVLVVNLNIDFDLSTRNANDIWGYHPHTMWIPQKLQVPPHFPGSLLLLDPSFSFQDIKRIEETLEWQTYYDHGTGWLCVGDTTYREGDRTVAFLTHVLAVVRQHKLKALWLQPEMDFDPFS